MERFFKNLVSKHLEEQKRNTLWTMSPRNINIKPDYGPLNAKNNAPEIPKAILDKFKGPESGLMLTFLGDMFHKVPLFCSSKCYNTKIFKIYP